MKPEDYNLHAVVLKGDFKGKEVHVDSPASEEDGLHTCYLLVNGEISFYTKLRIKTKELKLVKY